MSPEKRLDPDATAAAGESSSETQSMDSAAVTGRTIDRYRLLQKIGEGGMGEVWLAEQREPVRRRVALKLVKSGLNSREVIARFESERQALALMDHPAIATVLDAGATPEGLPYFVMEYVAGIPITDYCDSHKLTTSERLELFMRVCDGVQHAHQKAIIHRDLKPSNILVSELDGRAAPKIIDFGVAKALTQKLTAETMFTRLGVLVGTPEYMSPEQALTSGEDIDTRTDVYSLGIIFYELLAGEPPLELRKIAFDEFLRRLREEDPPRPSTRIRTKDKATSDDVARKRQTAPVTLARQLRGDLDSIALKALEKDRTRRYPSASEFAADIQRYLRSETVQAMPPSTAYRARKFARRHWAGLLAASLALVGVCGGAAVSIYQARIAQQRFQQVRKLANTFLFQFHDEIKEIPGTTKARALLVKTALEYLDNLSLSAGRDVALRAELAQAYRRVADVQGATNAANLGDSKGAVASLERAVALYQPITGRDPKYLREQVDCLRVGAVILVNEHQGPESNRWLERAMAAARPFESDPKALGFLTNLYNSAGDVQMLASTGESAEPLYRKSVGYVDEWARTVSELSEAAKAFQVSITHLRLARCLISSGRLEEGAREFEITAANNQKALASDPRNVSYIRNQTSILLSQMELYGSVIYSNLERPDLTLRYARAGEAVLADRIAADPNDFNARMSLAAVQARIAKSLWQLKQPGAIEEARQAVALWKELRASGRLTNTDAFAVALDIRNLTPVLGAQNKAEAVAVARDIVAETRRVFAGFPADDDNNLYVSLALCILGDAQRAAGNRVESQRAFDEAVSIAKPLVHVPSASVLEAYITAELAHRIWSSRADLGGCTEAVEWWRNEVGVWRNLAPKTPYAAMRLKRAQGDAPACGEPPAR